MNDGADPAVSWRWHAGMAEKLRLPFGGADSIARSFSQAWQDIFVLAMLGGMRGGRYLEIGAQQPVRDSNTCLLERQFGWSGISVEIDPVHARAWDAVRPSAT